VIVDARGDASSAMATIERLRAAAPHAGIFAVAQQADPDLILQAMRAGANEFFTWPPADEAFQGAIRRTAARRETTQGARQAATTLVFFGAKGGAGTTTIAVNCGVELARLSKRPTVILDLKPGLGEVSLFLGVRPRFSLLDAIDNLHRLDREFLRELVVKHKSGLEILAGSDQFDRPGDARVRHNPREQNVSRCFWEERSEGQVVNRDTGQPFSLDDPCVSRRGSFGPDPVAYREALEAVKALVGDAPR